MVAGGRSSVSKQRRQQATANKLRGQNRADEQVAYAKNPAFEAIHPRDTHGQFAEKGQGASLDDANDQAFEQIQELFDQLDDKTKSKFNDWWEFTSDENREEFLKRAMEITNALAMNALVNDAMNGGFEADRKQAKDDDAAAKENAAKQAERLAAWGEEAKKDRQRRVAAAQRNSKRKKKIRNAEPKRYG